MRLTQLLGNGSNGGRDVGQYHANAALGDDRVALEQIVDKVLRVGESIANGGADSRDSAFGSGREAADNARDGAKGIVGNTINGREGSGGNTPNVRNKCIRVTNERQVKVTSDGDNGGRDGGSEGEGDEGGKGLE